VSTKQTAIADLNADTLGGYGCIRTGLYYVYPQYLGFDTGSPSGVLATDNVVKADPGSTLQAFYGLVAGAIAPTDSDSANTSQPTG